MKHSRNTLSRFVPILLVIVITVLAVAAVIAIGRSLMGGTEKKDTEQSLVDEGRTALLSSDLSRSVRLTVRGPIVADEKFRSYQIIIAPDSRVMSTFEGYLEAPLESKRLDNNVKAYEELVFALDKRKMMDGKALTEEENDLRGICATGKIYLFETLMNQNPVKKLWTSDCSGSKGSAAANVSEILDMFMRQIPEGNALARDVGLGQQETFFKL